MNDNELRRALNARLAGIVEQPDSQQRMLRLVRGEEPIVKKKLSVGLVLAIVLILVSVAALAYTLSRGYFEGIATLESEHGAYDEWSLEEKLALLGLMKEYGVSIDMAEADALLTGGMPDTEREQRIDQLMIDKYGIDGRMDNITLHRVLQEELGFIGDWPMEQKAWYSQMLLESGLMGGDDDVFSMPTEAEISPEEAIAIAQKEIMTVFELTEDDFAGYEPHWSHLRHVQETVDPYYEIEFYRADGEGERYFCYLFGDGRIISSEDIEGFHSPAEWKVVRVQVANECDEEARALYWPYAEEHGVGKLLFELWPLENQQELAELTRPVVERNMAANPDYADWGCIPYTMFRYGLPDENALPEAEAIERAHAAIGERFNLSDELLGYCELRARFYDVTDPAKPLWKITFIANQHWDEVEALGIDPTTCYRVLLDAHTGEVVDAYTYAARDDATQLEYATQRN